MDLLKQCQIWHEEEEHWKIVEALEAIDEEECTPEMDMELARAYNNLADPQLPQGIELLRAAVKLLLPYKEEYGQNYHWNFRIAYAYYYLDQEGEAIGYFKKALELHPGDRKILNTAAEIEEFIEDCEKRISIMNFPKNFRQKVKKAWEAFAGAEKELRLLVDKKEDSDAAEELMEKCSEFLHMAFEHIAYEIGFNGSQYELILSPEGEEEQLFMLDYFQRQVPPELLERWNFLVGRQAMKGMELRFDGFALSPADVQVWVERLAEHKIGVTLYCKKALPLLQEEEGRVWWMLSVLMDQELGELASMQIIKEFQVVDTPQAEKPISLGELSEFLKDMGISLEVDSQTYLERNYSGYEQKTAESENIRVRQDVYIGSSRCTSLVGEFLDMQSNAFNEFYHNGIAAGFFFYPLDGFPEENFGEKILDFREELEHYLVAKAPDAFMVLGGATGQYCGYFDFIAWDLEPVLEAAKEFFEQSSVEWASFHSFHPDAWPMRLKNEKED